MDSGVRTVRLRTLLNVNSLICVSIAFFACADQFSHLENALFLLLTGLAVAADVGVLRRIPRPVLNLLSVAIVVSPFVRMRLDTFVSVCMAAIMLMTAVKMMEQKQERDYVQILSLCIVAIVASVVSGTSETFLYSFFLFSILAGVQLLLATWFSLEPGAVLDLPGVRRILGRGVAIWLLMLPLGLFLFFVAPRASNTLQLFAGLAGGGQGFIGFSDEVSLGSVRSLQASGALAFRAEMTRVPYESLFWRGLILDTFRGNTWIAAQGRAARRGSFTAEGPRIVQHITLEPGQHNSYFALDMTVEVDGRDVVRRGEGIFVSSNRSRSQRADYTAVSTLSSVLKPTNPEIRKKLYLDLPPNYLPRLKTVVRQITARLDDAEKAEAVMKYLSPPNFEYSLDDLPVSRNALEYFIFDGKKGNCEYFASAMAVMLRMANVPTRLVAGYYGGTYNESGGYYIVDQSSAHVWVEVWIEREKAWQRYDPTPMGSLGGEAESSQKYGTLWLWLDVLNHRIARVFSGYDSEQQSGFVEWFRKTISSPYESFIGFFGYLAGVIRRPAAIAAIVFASLCAAFLRLRGKRQRGRISQETRLLHRFLRAMARQGFPRPPSAGLREFTAAIGDKPLQSLARRFCDLFEPYYFRDLPMDADTVRQLTEIIRQIKKRRRGGG